MVIYLVHPTSRRLDRRDSDRTTNRIFLLGFAYHPLCSMGGVVVARHLATLVFIVCRDRSKWPFGMVCDIRVSCPMNPVKMRLREELPASSRGSYYPAAGHLSPIRLIEDRQRIKSPRPLNFVVAIRNRSISRFNHTGAFSSKDDRTFT